MIFSALLLSEFGAGLGVMILDVNAGAVIIARTPDRIRARATGAFRTLNYGIRPFGAFLGGVLGTAIGVRETLLIIVDRTDARRALADLVAGDPPAGADGAGRVKNRE